MLADIIVIAILVVIVALVIRTIIKESRQEPAVWNGLQPLQGLSLIPGMVCMKHRMGISWKELICRLSCICRHR